MAHKVLVRSSLIAATAALIPVAAANAQTVHGDEASFTAAAAGAGNSLLFTETFEEGKISGYEFFNAPLTMGVAHGSFAAGLTENMTIGTINNSRMTGLQGNAYYANITSNAMGSDDTLNDALFVKMGGSGVFGVGFEVHGIQSFIAGGLDNVDYNVYSTSGALVGTGSLAIDNSTTGGDYFGFVSNVAIGNIELKGTRFGSMAGTMYLDNIQAWNVPAPGSLALLGLGGLVATRRRR